MERIEMKVPIEVKLGIDLETAEVCLKLVEIYLNNHNEVYLEEKRKSDGTYRLRFANAD